MNNRLQLSILFILVVFITIGNCCRTGSSFLSENGGKAIAIMKGALGNNTVLGTVKFEQASSTDPVKITINITGLPKGVLAKHGIHIHQNGITDVSDLPSIKCASSGSHFNPLNTTHGDILAPIRHVGDLGNVVSDINGNIIVTFTDNGIKLFGPFGIIGRTIVLHEGEDDLGLKNDVGSKTFGNSGARVACGVIGIFS